MDNDLSQYVGTVDRWNFVNLGYNDLPEDFTRFYKNVQNNIDTEELQLETYFTQLRQVL